MFDAASAQFEAVSDSSVASESESGYNFVAHLANKSSLAVSSVSFSEVQISCPTVIEFFLRKCQGHRKLEGTGVNFMLRRRS